jgi:hypothetical protein
MEAIYQVYENYTDGYDDFGGQTLYFTNKAKAQECLEILDNNYAFNNSEDINSSYLTRHSGILELSLDLPLPMEEFSFGQTVIQERELERELEMEENQDNYYKYCGEIDSLCIDHSPFSFTQFFLFCSSSFAWEYEKTPEYVEEESEAFREIWRRRIKEQAQADDADEAYANELKNQANFRAAQAASNDAEEDFDLWGMH